MAVIFILVRVLIMVTLCIFGPLHTLTVVFKAVVFNNTVVVATANLIVNFIFVYRFLVVQRAIRGTATEQLHGLLESIGDQIMVFVLWMVKNNQLQLPVITQSSLKLVWNLLALFLVIGPLNLCQLPTMYI